MTRFDSSLAYAYRALALGDRQNDAALRTTAIGLLIMDYARINRPDSLFRLSADFLSLCSGQCPLSIPVLTLASRYWEEPYRLALLKVLEEKSREAPAYTRGRVLDELGFYYTDVLHRPAEAIAYHRAVDSLRVEDVWSAYGMGRAFRQLGMPDSATKYFGLQLEWSRTEGVAWAEGFALANLGEVCQKDVVPPRLECAMAYYDSTITLVQTMLRELGSDDNRVAAAEFAWEVYEDQIFAFLGYENVVGKERAERAALVVSEFGRALGLLDYLRSGDGAGDTDPHNPAASVLSRTKPYEVLEFGDSTTYTLSYFLGRDTLLVWLALPDRSVHLTRHKISNDSVVALVKSVRQEIGVDASVIASRMRGLSPRLPPSALSTEPSASAEFRSASAALLPADLVSLVPPGSDLVIIAQSVLALLPFAALPVPAPFSGDLGSRYAIRYAPSMSVIRDLEGTQASRTKQRLPPDRVVMSNPRMPLVDLGEVLNATPEGLTTLPALPASQVEGKWIAQALTTQNISGADATETRLLADLPRSDIVHLATHAVATEYASLARQSFLALAPDSTNDGLLTVGELLELPSGSIPARLVVLSACQTAIGPVRFIEGIMGLQRAFLAKGAESVLASLWSVNDEATEHLMTQFYAHWLDDADRPTKAESLRRAQDDVRHIPGFEHPIYWAAFQLVGLN